MNIKKREKDKISIIEKNILSKNIICKGAEIPFISNPIKYITNKRRSIFFAV
jgi:hypothetical protein